MDVNKVRHNTELSKSGE